MANLAQSLNSEIRRLARREANALVAPLRTTITQLRREIWRLNRDNRALDKQIQQAPRTATGLPVVDPAAAASGKIGPRLIAILRRRLDLSQQEFAVLLDVNAKSISNWETGTTRPSADMRVKLMAARQLGRRDVKRMLKEKAEATKPSVKAPAVKAVSKPGKGVAEPKGVQKEVAKATTKKAKAPKKTPAKKAVEAAPVESAPAAAAPEINTAASKRPRK